MPAGSKKWFSFAGPAPFRGHSLCQWPISLQIPHLVRFFSASMLTR